MKMDKKGQIGILLLGWLVGLFGVAAGQGTGVAKIAEGVRFESRAEYAGELQRMAGVVSDCRGQVLACDAKVVPADASVRGEGAEPEFRVRWEWLRAALKTASGGKDQAVVVASDEDAVKVAAKPEDRGLLLDRAGERLREDLAELSGTAISTNDADASRKMKEVLGRREFGQVQQTQWWERVLAKIYKRVDEWWSRVVGVVPWSPWIGVTFEWGLLGAAGVGLAVWAMRLSKQQRISFQTEREFAPAWKAESDDWAAKAREEAAKGEWREAVHCLYWSAIVMLEGQKLWRQNRARTPREYVGLLEPGSARRKVLGGLTSVFERIWYGIRPATGEDYERASKLLEELRG